MISATICIWSTVKSHVRSVLSHFDMFSGNIAKKKKSHGVMPSWQMQILALWRGLTWLKPCCTESTLIIVGAWINLLTWRERVSSQSIVYKLSISHITEELIASKNKWYIDKMYHTIHENVMTWTHFPHMMTSSNGNIFRVTGHLCGKFTGPRWIPCTKASDAELWCFLWSATELTVE